MFSWNYNEVVVFKKNTHCSNFINIINVDFESFTKHNIFRINIDCDKGCKKNIQISDETNGIACISFIVDEEILIKLY